MPQRVVRSVTPPLDSDLAAIANLATHEFGRSLLTQASQSNARSLLGIPSSLMPAELIYTVSQSSVYDAGNVCLGTYEKLTDGSNTTGAGTLSAAAGATGVPQWIRIDLGTPKDVQAISLSAGSLGGGFGSSSSYLNSSIIQISNNATDWTTIFAVTGTTNNSLPGTSGVATPVFFDVYRRTRYMRLLNTTTWCATTEWRVFGWNYPET